MVAKNKKVADLFNNFFKYYQKQKKQECKFGNTFYVRKKITNFQCNSENKKYQAMAVFKRVAQRRPVLNFSCVDKNFIIK